MQLSQLRAFAALVETGSFTEAAFSINLTQSAVSHALATLEKELGVTLLERDRQGSIHLSTIGQKVLQHAQAILMHMETIQQEAAIALNQTAGKLRLGSMPFVPPRQLEGVLSHFQQRYPMVEVILFEGSGLEVYEWVNNGIVDVGFVPYDEKGLVSTLITIDELRIIMPEEHPLRKEQAFPHKKLRNEQLIMPKDECDLVHHLQLAPKGKDRHISIRYKASDSTTIQAMVREGIGIALLPSMLLSERLEGIKAMSLNPPEYMQLGLAVKSPETASPAAQVFIQEAQQWSQEHGFLRQVQPPDNEKKQTATNLVEHTSHR